MQRSEPDVLDRQRIFFSHIQFASSLGLADPNPIGRLIAGAAESRNLAERLEQYRADGITLLPVLGQTSLAACEAGIEVSLYHAQQVKQLRGRKTDIQDARWLARVCQFGLGQPSYVPSKFFRDLRQMSRYRRKLIGQRSQVRNQVHKQLDQCGLLIGGILTDVFGVNGRRILDGIVRGRSSQQILDSLSVHVHAKRERFEDALQANLSEPMRFVLSGLLSQHDSLEAQIKDTDLMLKQLLCTIPGIKWDSAAAIFIELGGDLSVFPNAQAESWFATLKRECVLKTDPLMSAKELRRQVIRYIESWYNTRRIHTSLGNKSPVEYEVQLKKAQAAVTFAINGESNCAHNNVSTNTG